MRIGVALGVGAILLTVLHGQARQEDQEPIRQGIHADLKSYPQTAPQEALGSALTAIDKGRIDYLLAQLTDPDFVDQRVKQVYGGDFDEFERETRTKLNDSPETVKVLRRFQKDGDWETQEDKASARLKDIPDRMVFMRKIGKRWYLENRQRPERREAER